MLGETSKRLLELYGKMISEGTVSPESKIVFVDDGSRDRTWEIISGLCEQNNIYRGVKLAHNARTSKRSFGRFDDCKGRVRLCGFDRRRPAGRY